MTRRGEACRGEDARRPVAAVTFAGAAVAAKLLTAGLTAAGVGSESATAAAVARQHRKETPLPAEAVPVAPGLLWRNRVFALTARADREPVIRAPVTTRSCGGRSGERDFPPARERSAHGRDIGERLREMRGDFLLLCTEPDSWRAADQRGDVAGRPHL